MQAADITAGRGGLALFNESLGHLRGIHSHLANTLGNFASQQAQANAQLQNTLNTEDAKAYQKMRDSIADAQAQRVQELKEQAHALNAAQSTWQQQFSQKQAATQKEQWDKTYAQKQEQFNKQYALDKQKIKAQVGLTNAQIKAQQGANYNLGVVIESSGRGKDIKAANTLQRPLIGKYNPPPLLKPNYKPKSVPAPPPPPMSTPLTPPPNPPNPKFGGYTTPWLIH